MLTPRGVGGGHTRVRRRGGAGRAVAALVVAAVIAAACVIAWSQASESGPDRSAGARPTCPSPSPEPTAVPAGRIRVKVLNGTDRRGLATTVAEQLRKRGFRVFDVGNDQTDRQVTGTADVRSGPAGAAAARTVAAQVASAVLAPDDRRDASVDLVLGPAFRRLQSPAEAAAALRPSPAPVPSGCPSR